MTGSSPLRHPQKNHRAEHFSHNTLSCTIKALKTLIHEQINEAQNSFAVLGFALMEGRHTPDVYRR